MKYMGSKARFANELLPIILKDRKEGQWYVEPFCGGCNMIDKVTGNRMACDNNPFLIAMWNGLVYDISFRPRMLIDKEYYSSMRDKYNKDKCGQFLGTSEMAEIGWVGFMGSFNGRFFDGGYSGHNVGNRDYISEQIKNTSSQIPHLKGVVFLRSKNVFFIRILNILLCASQNKIKVFYMTMLDKHLVLFAIHYHLSHFSETTPKSFSNRIPRNTPIHKFSYATLTAKSFGSFHYL